MINEPNHNGFLRDFMTCLIIALVMVVLCLILSSCDFFRRVQRTETEVKSDSANVKKVTETSSKIDTSKTSTVTTKELFTTRNL